MDANPTVPEVPLATDDQIEAAVAGASIFLSWGKGILYLNPATPSVPDFNRGYNPNDYVGGLAIPRLEAEREYSDRVFEQVVVTYVGRDLQGEIIRKELFRSEKKQITA